MRMLTNIRYSPILRELACDSAFTGLTSCSISYTPNGNQKLLSYLLTEGALASDVPELFLMITMTNMKSFQCFFTFS